MVVRVKWSALKQSRWYEYVLRFVLGGLATVMAGAVAAFTDQQWEACSWPSPPFLRKRHSHD